MWQRLGLMVAVILLVSTPASAEVWDGLLLIGPSAGPTLPIGRLDDSLSSGSLIGVTGQRFSSMRFGLGVELQTGWFGESRSPRTTIQQAIISGSYVLSPYSENTLLLTGGMGVYMLKPDYQDAERTTNFGLNAGVGVLVPFGKRIKSSTTLRLHHLFTEDASTNYVGVVFALYYAFGDSPYQ
ncbi:MAG: hypothetical protein GF341_12160 [candidate division Zixibacteria bacterium]|nr:hypothetical protein [candidate division Zixibacteria bacterium]